MALQLGFWENEGFRVYMRRDHIDVIVRKILGERRKREARIEVFGVPSLNLFYLQYCNGMFKIRDDLGVGVRDTLSGTKNIQLNIETPYCVERGIFNKGNFYICGLR